LPLRLRVKVLDFGIAKLRGDLSDGLVNTRTGALMGTPQYMSPEQCRGVARKIDHRTDIYALGIIVYEMVCGSPPFAAEGMGDMLMLHLHRAPDPPRTRNADTPEPLEAAILRALAKDPDQRFATMIDFREALRPTDAQSAATVGMTGHAPLAMAPTIDASAPLPALGPQADAFAPTQAAAQDATAPADGPWMQGPSTTLASTAGQVSGAHRHRMTEARRIVVATGVLAVAGLAIMAAMLHKAPSHQGPRPPPQQRFQLWCPCPCPLRRKHQMLASRL
jgi:serine/threonine-protein kinase